MSASLPKRPAGYTLVELLVVMAVILILASLATVAVFKVSAQARDSERVAQTAANRSNLGGEFGNAPLRNDTRTIRVLFIGNSYTSVNDLPGMLRSLARSAGFLLETEQVTVGGATLEDHVNSGTAAEKMKQASFDYVVLQEQSMRPLLERSKMLAAAKQLDPLVRDNGATTLLYMTWARQHLPLTQADLKRAYFQVAEQTQAKVAPVGLAWQAVLASSPGIVLHQADKSHPTPEGTYLAACVFYAWLYNRSPEGLNALGISAADAKTLQQAAWRVVDELE